MYGLLPIFVRYLPKLLPIRRDNGRPGLTVAAIASISRNLRPAECNASSHTFVIFSRCKSRAKGGMIPPFLFFVFLKLNYKKIIKLTD